MEKRPRNVAVIGTGKMGAGIFKVLQNKSLSLTLVAVDQEEAQRQETRFIKGLERQLKRGDIGDSEWARQRDLTRFTHRLSDLSDADLVIEAVFEDPDLKRSLFQELESVVPKDTVLVSNTSSISIREMASHLTHKHRFCGLHFFHPVMLMNLVEIIRWQETPTGLIKFLKDFAKTMGKQAIVVEDAPASVINATLSYYYVEALYILEEGNALPSKVDELARRWFYVGPCESMDVVGLDFFLAGLKRAATPGSLLPIDWTDDGKADIRKEDLGGREGFHVPYLFRKLIAENRLGKKGAKGIYLYKKDKPVDDNPGFYLDTDRGTPGTASRVSEDVLAKRLLYSIFNGCIYSAQRGMSTAEELDLGIKEVLLMKQGPFTMMRALGEDQVRRDFELLAQDVGKRFSQTSYNFLTP